MKRKEKTASGIIIPDSAKEKPRQGKVILVGVAKKDEEMEVKERRCCFFTVNMQVRN